MKTTVTIVYELPEDEVEYDIHQRAADNYRLCEQMIEDFKANVACDGSVSHDFLVRIYDTLLEIRGD